MGKKFKYALWGAVFLASAFFASEAKAQAYKMLAPSGNQQLFYGSTTVTSGSITVSVLTAGTVSAALANFASLSGSNTAQALTTWSGGNITIQAYDTEGIASTVSGVSVNYIGAGSK